MQPIVYPLAAVAAAAVGHFAFGIALFHGARGPGGVLVVMGIGLVAWAVGLQFRIGTHPEVHHPTTALATTGAYRFSRNPIYVGLLVVQAGVGLASGMWLAAALVPMSWWGLDRIVRREEAQLAAQFGQEYERYLQATRRWL